MREPSKRAVKVRDDTAKSKAKAKAKEKEKSVYLPHAKRGAAPSPNATLAAALDEVTRGKVHWAWFNYGKAAANRVVGGNGVEEGKARLKKKEKEED